MQIGITIAIVLVIVFIGLIFLVNSKRHRFSERHRQWFKTHWEMIIEESQKNPNAAILEADKLLDKALSAKGFKGSLGEKLKKGGKKFSNINHVWEAHKLRNRIAHELNVKLSKHETGRALNQFKHALKDLGIPL